MSYRYLIALFILLSSFSYADSITEKCTAINADLKTCSSIDPSISFDSKSSDALLRWTWFYDKVQLKKKLLQAEIDNNVGMFRFLRHNHVEDDESKSWYEEKYVKTRRDFDNLKIILDQIERTSTQLNLCFKLCGPKSRLEKEETLKKLLQLKIILLSKNPILASPSIEELVEKESITNDEFKKVLSDSYINYLRGLKSEINEINYQFGAQERQLNFVQSSSNKSKPSRTKHFFELISNKVELDEFKSDLISSMDWESEFKNSDNIALSCKLYKENLDYNESQKNKVIVTEVGLVVLPLIAGPAFRVSAWGLRATGLAKWGMRDELYASTTRALSGSVASGVFVSDLYKLSGTNKQCVQNLNDFIQNNDSVDYQRYTACIDETGDRVLMLAIESSFAAMTGIKAALNSIKISKSFDEGKTLFNVKDKNELHHILKTKVLDSETFGDAGLKLTTRKGDYFVLNLNGPQEEVKNIGQNYWDFVAKTYKKRLKLSNEEIKSFIESSNQMSDRTTLLVSTTHGNKSSFRGGVAMVSSKRAQDLMPFEKATGVRVQRVPGEKTAEIVRLTVSEKRGDKKLSTELISQVVSTFKANVDYKKMYVYTSKSHHRLYQRMLKKLKIKSKVLHDLDRDVILEIDVSNK